MMSHADRLAEIKKSLPDRLRQGQNIPVITMIWLMSSRSEQFFTVGGPVCILLLRVEFVNNVKGWQLFY